MVKNKKKLSSIMQKCCDRLKIPHTVFSSVEDFVSLPARTVSVVLLSCSASSLGARDESCEMGVVSFPLQMTMAWLLSTVATDSKPSEGDAEQVWVGDTDTEGGGCTEGVTCLSMCWEAAFISVLDIPVWTLIEELVADGIGEFCRDGK